jgi:serine/threonine protein kinase/PAS domain-containing protein
LKGEGILDTRIPILLAEQEADTISVVTLFLSEIQQVQLAIAYSAEESLIKFAESPASLVLFADGLQGAGSIKTVEQIHRDSPSTYIIVSLAESNPERVSEFMIIGANDCIIKNAQYVPNLVQAVKKALTRIAERKSFSISPMPRADQFAVDENLPDIIFYLSAAGKVLYANRAIQSILGVDQRSVINRPFEELIHHQDQRIAFREYMSGKDSHPSFRRMISLADKSGHPKDFDIDLALREGDIFYGVARPMQMEGDRNKAGEKSPPGLPTPADGNHELPVRIGPYRVLTLLGAGSMGRVYKGFDEQLERYVAIKVVGKKLAATQDYVDRFHREAKLLASLMHPNIALVYYFGTLEGLPYFCMEYMPGGSLENLLRQQKTLKPETAISHTMQVAIGLSKAFEKGIVHLDVKPSNLMIAENDRIKIVDFGLARTLHQLQNIPSHIIGTPLYVAPEQIRGGMVDFRCDIFSLGITFFQMLYGFVPHAAPKVQEVFRRRLKEGIPLPDDLDASVPKTLYEIIRRMTLSDPADRYGSYADLIADLEAVRRGKVSESVEMSPPAGSAVYMRGLLYDRPFAEVLGHIASSKLSGKLTLSWFDLCKNLHFKDGEIIAVMSNQEGESFVDLLLKQNQLGAGKARQLEAGSSDLFSNYSSAMNELTQNAKLKLTGELQDLAWRILQGLFSWVVGEFLFEEGNFPAQSMIQIRTGEVIVSGVRAWMDYPTIHRRMLGGRCRITLNPNFQRILPVLSVGPADAFILFRFEESIPFRELMDLSGIADDEFFRLIYLYSAVGILRIEEITEERNISRSPRKIAPQPPRLEPSERTPVEESPPEQKPIREERPVIPPQPAATGVATPVTRMAPPTGKELAMYYYQCAVNSFASKNYWAAVEYCRKALELKQEGRIYRLMGNALATHRAFHHEAMEAYRNALQRDPKSFIIEREIGDLYFQTGNYALARSRYQAVLKKNPEDQHSQQRLKEIIRLKK